MKSILRKMSLVIAFTATISSCAIAMPQSNAYAVGQKQLDEQQWQAAQQTFSTIVENKDGEQDAALYWLAYAQFKNNQKQAALKAVKSLQKRFPDSRWIDDANALKVEIQDSNGNSNAIEDDELKLYAINSLMNSSSDKAVALLSKIIHGDNSEKLAKRALFVLSQFDTKEAFELVAKVATDDTNETLQREAIKVLGHTDSKKSARLLKKIYQNTTHETVKARILKSFMTSDNTEALLAVAKSEQNETLKVKALKLLGLASGSKELLALYNDSHFANNRDTIIKSIAINGDAESLLSIINAEKDSELQVKAVRRLGLTSSNESGEILGKLYTEQSDPKIRAAVIHALFLQSNAKVLISIIQQETDPKLKRKALKKLTLIDSDEAIEYFSTVLGS
jgi:HEAT repeat protein